jgi:hypothetical protein
MLHYLKNQSHAFSPEMVQVLVEALDEAWRRVQASGAAFDDRDGTAREALAKCIVDIAQEGERNRERLVEGALLRFKL